MIWLSAVIGYLLGGLNGAVILGKILKTDVRRQGSKNAGATNTLRVLGKSAAVIVVIIDALKGVAAVAIASFLDSSLTAAVAAGFCCVVGHSFPVYFGFRGGKGVITSCAVMLMLNWVIGLTLLAVALVLIAVTRYVSLGSCVSALCLPALALALSCETPFVIFSFAACAFVLFMHRGNIHRLIKGKENKL